MTTKHFTHTPLVPLAVAAMPGSAFAVGEESVADLIAKIKNPDDAVRGPAWQSAGKFGAAAVKPLAETMAAADRETARAARRALWKIVRYAGRPGAATEQKAVAARLVSLLTKTVTETRRELLWMLSEIGGDDAVAPVASLLSERELREDARAALQRIPGDKSLAALKSALATAPEDFRFALAVSLRARGEKVSGYPSQKLVPTKQTEVKPVSAG